MNKAIINYSEAIYAPQTLSSKSAMRNTWAKLARKFSTKPLPVMVELVHQVVFTLKAARYKAAGSYVSEALHWHRREGYPVSNTLEMAVRDTKRVITRTIGPKKRAAEIKFQWLSTLVTKIKEEYQLPTWPNHRLLV